MLITDTCAHLLAMNAQGFSINYAGNVNLNEKKAMNIYCLVDSL